MKKYLFLTAILCILAIPLNVAAYRIDLASHEGLSGASWAEVLGDGTNAVTFDLGLAPGTIADIRSFFFDLGVGQSIANITVNSLTDVNNDFTVFNVITNSPPYLASSVHPSADMQGAGSFGFGVEFGRGGIGNNKGDIRAVNFTVFGNSNLILGQNFGMRLMSFGDGRNGSRKMVVQNNNPPPPPNPVPEPSTMLLFGAGLIGFASVARMKRK